MLRALCPKLTHHIPYNNPYQQGKGGCRGELGRGADIEMGGVAVVLLRNLEVGVVLILVSDLVLSHWGGSSVRERKEHLGSGVSYKWKERTSKLYKEGTPE